MNPGLTLRHELHRFPELSGQERDTARRVGSFFHELAPDQTITGLGGNGLAFVFGEPGGGPTVLLRCELDALPIPEAATMAWASSRDGVSHKCGHDGHMAILAEVGRHLAARRPRSGRVVLLFQPAEETGRGAAAVIADPRFASFRPDWVFALHNVPGFPVGQVVSRPGPFACASRGLDVQFRGRTAHAAQPETGVSPASAMCDLVTALNRIPERLDCGDELAFGTVVGARLGDRAFGTAPGEASVMATLRSETDATMARMLAWAENHARQLARRDGLQVTLSWDDVFPATINSERAVNVLEAVVPIQRWRRLDAPFRWSEDFGHFTAMAEGAMFGLGAGEDTPALHDQAYDFPDQLVPAGAEVFLALVDAILAA